jgi:hypothetical protein
VLKSHGHTPIYIKTNLAPASRAELAATGLHFRDLRCDASSRWMDAGVPLPTIPRRLGHATSRRRVLAVEDIPAHCRVSGILTPEG